MRSFFSILLISIGIFLAGTFTGLIFKGFIPLSGIPIFLPSSLIFFGLFVLIPPKKKQQNLSNTDNLHDPQLPYIDMDNI